MAEEKKKYNNYHLTVQLSNTYWSYKKPGDNGAYAMMYVSYYNNMLSLHFKRGITSENVLDLNCYLSDGKAFDLSRLFEGMMARRRDAYAEGKNYDADEVIKIPCTSIRDGKEVSVGLLVIDTEMYDGIPRVRFSYTDHEKNDTIEVVFNARVPSGPIEAKCKANNIDYADIHAFHLANILKEVQNPVVPIMYRIQDAAVSSLSKFISACLNGNRNNIRNNDSQPSYNSSDSYGGDSYEPF